MGTIHPFRGSRALALSPEDQQLDELRVKLMSAESLRRDGEDELPGYGELYDGDMRAIELRARLACADIDPCATDAERDRQTLLDTIDSLVDAWRGQMKEHRSDLKSAEDTAETADAEVERLRAQLDSSEDALQVQVRTLTTELAQARADLETARYEVSGCNRRIRLREQRTAAVLASDGAAQREAAALRGERVARKECERALARLATTEEDKRFLSASLRGSLRKPIDVACPRCASPAGEPCRAVGSVGVKGSRMGSYHRPRVALAKRVVQ